MKIAVCVKQVPDTGNVKLDPTTHTLKREGVKSILNPFDLFAIEAALRLKEQAGGEIHVLTMGPPQAAEVLKEAIGYGVDEAYLLSDRAFAGADTWATTAVLAAAVKKIGGVDLVICGKQAIDGDTAQVGPGMAFRLGLPQVAFVKGFRQADGAGLTLERQMDDGFDVVKTPLPALITVVREVGEPRPPSLKGKMRAKKYQPQTFGMADLGLGEGEVGLAGSFTQVVEVFAPTAGGDREMFSGPEAESAARVIDRLVADKIIAAGS